MSQNKWDDEKIEKLLSNIPKAHDNRSKDEILQRLKDDGVFDDKPTEQILKQKKQKWIPPVIIVAAIALIAILIPSLMNGMNDSSNETATTLDNSQIEKAEMKVMDDKTSGTEEFSNSMGISSTVETDHMQRTSVYPEDLEGYTAFHIGLVSDQADSIPFTFLIPNEKVMEDLGKSNPTEVELYNFYAPQIDETSLGFQEYHPYVGSITENGNSVVHTLPSNHGYDMGTASLGAYTGSLIDTFKSYENVKFNNESGSVIEFDQVGEATPLQVQSEQTKYNYFKYTTLSGAEFLSTNGRRAYSSVTEALNNMKVEDNDIYQKVILQGVDYSIREDGKKVVVSFSKELDLNNYDQNEAMQMIEAILLTAASFDMEVEFENIVQTNWGGFDFTSPLPIPVGPNKQYL